jgi:nitrite reductase/ring-hydroxylating ferredoxin subunit
MHMLNAELLRRPVRALRWEPGQVTLTADGGAPVTARAVVVTVPPPLVASGRLTITPMPQRKAAAARALPAGDGLCAIAVLASAAPESAAVFDADGRAGFVRATAGRPEVLVVAKAGAASAVRAAGVARVVARALPWSAGMKVTSIQVADWGRDPWSAGVFSHPAVGQPGGTGLGSTGPADPVLRRGGGHHRCVPPSVHGAFGSMAARGLNSRYSDDEPSERPARHLRARAPRSQGGRQPPGGWQLLAFAHELTEQVTAVSLASRALVAIRDQGRIRVFDGTCPHRGAHLGHGGKLIDGQRILCPFHGKVIGLGAGNGDLSVREHDVIDCGAVVFVKLSDISARDHGFEGAIRALLDTHALVPALTTRRRPPG